MIQPPGLRMALEQNRRLGLFGVPWSKFRLVLRQATIVASGANDGDAVTGWTNATRDATLNATATACVLDTTLHAGHIGVRFNGTTSHLDRVAPASSVIWSDDGVTVFIVKHMTADPVVGRGVFWTTSDDGTDGRGAIAMSAFGSVRVESQGLGPTQYTDPDKALHVDRIHYTGPLREIWRDGQFAAANCVSGGSPRDQKKFRIGSLFQGAWWWAGVVYEVYVAVGITRAQAVAVERGLMAEYGIAASLSFTTIQAATDTASDPRFMLPAVIPAVVGRPVTFFRDAVHYRDGRDDAQAFTADLPVDRSLPDRWVVTPTQEGTSGVLLVEGAFETVGSVVAVAAKPTGPTLKVHPFGDSNMGRAIQDGWVHNLVARNARISCIGSTGTAPLAGSGVDSTTWVYWNGGSSPWAMGTGTFNAASLALFTAAYGMPDVLIGSIQNDATDAAQEAVATTFTARTADIANVIATWRAVNPDVLVLLLTIYPGATDPATGWGAWSTRLVFREKWQHWAELLKAWVAGLGDPLTKVVDTFDAVDGFGYPAITGNGDAHHPGRYVHAYIADRIEAALTHYAL